MASKMRIWIAARPPLDAGKRGLKIARDLLRHAHVREDHALEVLVVPPLAHEPDGHDAEPLLERFAHSVHALRARRRAADVDVMGGVDDEADDAVADEHRARHEAVGEVAGAEEGVVEEHRVAGLQRLVREVLSRTVRTT